MSTPERQVSEREETLIRYFRKIPERPTGREARLSLAIAATCAVAGILAAVGAGVGCGHGFLAILCLVVAVIFVVKGVRRLLLERYAYEKALVGVFPQSPDRDVDQWFAEARARLRKHSLEKLELTEEQCGAVELPPIIAPVVWMKPGIAPEDVTFKIGQDGEARFGVYQISYLWLAEDLVGIFSCDYDLIRDVVLNEETREFFYQDIVSVATQEKSSSLTLPTGQSLTSVQEFRISVANDKYFEVVVGSSQLRELTGAERIPDSGTEVVMRAVRTRLREKKDRLLNR